MDKMKEILFCPGVKVAGRFELRGVVLEVWRAPTHSLDSTRSRVQ